MLLKLKLLILLLFILLVPLAFAGQQQDLYDASVWILECDGSAIVDNSTKHNTGTISGTVTMDTSTQKLGTGACNTTATGSVTFTNIGAYTGQTNLTITGWMKYSIEHYFIDYTDGTSDNDGEWNVLIYGDPDLYKMQVRVDGAQSALGQDPTAANDGNWHHFAWVFNNTGATTYMYSYIDGAESTSVGTFALQYRTSGTFTTLARDLKISWLGTDKNVGYFDGMAWYNISLNTDQIDYIYNSGSGRLNEPEPVDDTPPVISALTDISGGGTNRTDDTTPTYNLTTDENADCDTSADNATWVACSTTGALGHICTMPTAQAFAIGEDKDAFIKCDDAIPNSAYELIVYNITDVIAPITNITSPINLTFFITDFNNSIIFNISATDNHNSNFTLKFDINGTSYLDEPYLNASFVYVNISLPYGTYIGNNTAVDNQSNKAQLFVNFTVRNDTIESAVKINDTGGFFIRDVNNSFTVGFNATDNFNATFSIEAFLNGSSQYSDADYPNGTTIPLNISEEAGNYNFTVVAIDPYNNVGNFSLFFEIQNDSIAPNVSLLVPSNNSFEIMDYNVTEQFNFSCTDNFNVTFSAFGYVNDTQYFASDTYQNGSIGNLNTTLGEVGFYEWNISCADPYQNNATRFYFYEIRNDSEAPVVTLITPTNNSFGISGINVTNQFNFSCVDNINTTLSAVGYVNNTQYFASDTYQNGSTAEMNVSPDLEVGFYEWNVSCSDPYQNNATLFYFYEVRNDTSPPVVSNFKFFAINSSNGVIGEDETAFNSTNLQIIELMMVNFTVTDENQISDNYSLYFTANGSTPCSLGNNQSSTCISFTDFVEFRNGSTTQYFDDTRGFSRGDNINCTYDVNAQNTERKYSCLIDEHYNPNVAKHYPLNWSNVSFQSGVNQRIKSGTIWKIDLNGVTVPDNATFMKIDVRLNVSEITPTEPILAFPCNSLYNDTLGDAQDSLNCSLAGSNLPSELQDDGTKFRVIIARNLTDTLGNISHILLATDEVTGYYSVKTVEYLGEEGIWATISTDSGASYSVLEGGMETELNLNWVYNTSDDSDVTSIIFRVQSEDNRSNRGNSSNFTMQWDLPSTNFPPVVNLINPADGINTSSINPITWNTQDPNGDSYTTNITVYNGTTTNITIDLPDDFSSFDWSSVSIATGRYNLTVESCENVTAELFCANDTHEIFFDAVPPDSFFSNTSLTGNYRVLAFNSSNPIRFNATDDFYSTFRVNISVNGTEVYFNSSYENGSEGSFSYLFFKGYWLINITSQDGSDNLNWTSWEMEIDELPVNFTYNVNDCYNASSLGDCFAVNWSKAWEQINWSDNETIFGGNYTWNFTDKDIPSIPLWQFNLTNHQVADITVNITLNFTNTSRWQLFYRGNNLTTDTTFKGFINVSGSSTIRVNLSLNLYNITQRYVNFTLNRSTANWGFNFSLNATTRTAG